MNLRYRNKLFHRRKLDDNPNKPNPMMLNRNCPLRDRTPLTIIALLIAGILFSYGHAPALAAPAALELDAQGWTQIHPRPDSRIIYVSSSTGHDSNQGLSLRAPLRSIKQGISLLRDGKPDWLLLKRGDIWTHQSFGIWKKSGRSPTEPMLISSYGRSGGRPLIQTGTEHGFRTEKKPVSYLAIVGIHLNAHTYTDQRKPTGIRWVSGGHNILIEDVMIQGYKTNITMQALAGPIRDVTIRRSVIVDAFASNAHSQGMYAKGINSLTVQGNVFDHNGWNPQVKGASKTVFNHNLYIQTTNTDVVVRGNIFSRASSHGVQLRPGGILQDNLFIRNPIALSFGYVLGSSAPVHGGVTGQVRGNVILQGTDIGGKPRGYGMQIGNTSPHAQTTISHNILAQNISTATHGRGIALFGNNGGGIHNLMVTDNLIYNWPGSLDISGSAGKKLTNITISNNLLYDDTSTRSLVTYRQTKIPDGFTYQNNMYYAALPPTDWFRIIGSNLSFEQWVRWSGETNAQTKPADHINPTRSIATYNASLGGQPTFDAFITQARSRSKHHDLPKYTATAVNQYLRDGFGVPNPFLSSITLTNDPAASLKPVSTAPDPLNP